MAPKRQEQKEVCASPCSSDDLEKQIKDPMGLGESALGPVLLVLEVLFILDPALPALAPTPRVGC